MEEIPGVQFDEEVDWRKIKDDEQDNDEDLPTSQELIDMLGFDPDKEG